MPRGKSYETAAEKQRAYRLRKMGLEKKDVNTEDVVGDTPPDEEKVSGEPSTPDVVALPERKLTAADQKFDEDRPGWYIFGQEVKEGKCWTCGKPFKTQLEMNRFCSPKCKNEYLATISSSKNEIPV